MSNDHYVTLEGDNGDIHAAFVCLAGDDASCRNTPDCECEEWHNGSCKEEYPDGPPLVPRSYCNHGEFIDTDGAHYAASRGKVRVPVTTRWSEGTYVYDFDGGK